MNHNIDMEVISSMLDAEKHKEVLNLLKEEKFGEFCKDNFCDIISVVISKIRNNTITLKPSFYGTCEELLSLIITKGSPQDATFELIEQILIATNDAQFSIALNPLQTLLIKLSTKRAGLLQYCLRCLKIYIKRINNVTEHDLEEKERLLMDSDSNVRRIIHLYSLLPPFYEPFIEELKTEYDTKSVDIIVSFLVCLLGKPFIYIDLDPECNYRGQFRQCCSTILEDICCLVKNVFKFFPALENFYNNSQTNKKEDSRNDEDLTKDIDKPSLTAISGLLYMIFSEDFIVLDFAVPQIYSNQYIVHSVLIAVVHLLQFTEYGPQAKALSLATSILKRLSDHTTHSLLSVPIHYELLEILIKVSIYSYYECNRKHAVKVIQQYVNKFNYNGRTLILKFIIGNANHSGMIGYAITLFKDSLDEAYNNPILPDCFTGVQLLSMIMKICHLPYGAESDIVELADQIIAALNLLRYLALKDCGNKTGIIEHLPFIETDYLDKLRTGLNMSKAHYEAKLSEINENKKIKKSTTVQITVAGNSLDNIPMNNKKEIINSALNAFHLIESLVGRLIECINMNKSHK